MPFLTWIIVAIAPMILTSANGLTSYMLAGNVLTGNVLTGSVCDQNAPSPYILRIVARGCVPGDHTSNQTGFLVVDPPTIDEPAIVTTLHGVANCKSIDAISSSHVITGVEISKVDFPNDIALLALPEDEHERFADAGFTTTTSLPQTDDEMSVEATCTVGYPLGSNEQWFHLPVKLQAKEKSRLYQLIPTDHELFDALIERPSPYRMANVLRIDEELPLGIVGAPIINEAGQVVAVIEGGLKDIGAPPISWAIQWADIAFDDINDVDDFMMRDLAQYDPRSVFALLATQTPTPTPSHTPTATPSRTPSRTPLPTPLSTPMPTATAPAVPATPIAVSIDLRILDRGLSDHTYFIDGPDIGPFAIGDDLIVYAEPNPNREVAIALLRVVGKSANVLTAQSLLIHPNFEIRAQMRVDNRLEFLSQSQLVPVFSYADGYLLREALIRLRPENRLAVGDMLQALEFERINGEIIDALPTDILMEVTRMGIGGQVAVVSLVTGSWPPNGTIVMLMPTPTPTPTPASSPTATATKTATAAPSPTATSRATATESVSPQLCAFSFLVLDDLSTEPIRGATVSVILGTQQDTGDTDSNGYYQSKLPCESTQQSEARVRIYADGYTAHSSRVYLINDTKAIFLEPLETPTPRATSTPRPTQTPTANSVDFRLGDWVGAAARSRIRAYPGTGETVLETLPRDEIFRIDGGPEEADGYTWWQVRALDGTVRGWIAYVDEDGEPSLLKARQVTPTPQSAPTSAPRANPTSPTKAALEIIKPKWGESISGPAEIRWRYSGKLGANQGFDLMLWYAPDPTHRGIADISKVMANLVDYGNGEYGVTLNVSSAPLVEHYCDASYLLYVIVVDLSPYGRTGIESEMIDVRIRPISGVC